MKLTSTRVSPLKAVATFLVCLALIYFSFYQSDLLLDGLDNPHYANAYDCTLRDSLADAYFCYIRTQGNPAPGLLAIYTLLSRIQLEYHAASRVLAVLFAISLSLSLRKYNLGLFLAVLIAGTTGYYGSYIIWSGHKQQLSLIFFFLFWDSISNAKTDKLQFPTVSYGLFAALSHAQQVVQLLIATIYFKFLAPASCVKPIVHKPIVQFVIKKKNIFYVVVLALIAVLGLSLGFAKLIGYHESSSKGLTLGTIMVAQLPLVMFLFASNAKSRLLVGLLGLLTLSLAFVIGASRVPTLFYYIILFLYCEYSSKGKFANKLMPAASFYLLFLFDVSRGFLAISQGTLGS